MSFFDKVKSMKNALTGGAAEVSLEVSQLSFNSPFNITVYARTQNAPVKINRVYVYLRGFEEINIPNVNIQYEDNGQFTSRRVNVSETNTTVEVDVTIANAQVLVANESYQWETEIQLPANAQLPYNGKYCQHYYKALAGLDCLGNDPDSGWITL